MKGRSIYNYLNSNQLIKDANKLSVLEVGCGAGGILKYFKDIGCSVKGVDLGGEYIQYGIDEHRLNLSIGTINDVDFSPDIIIYSHILEHVLNLREELKKIHMLLLDTGILYIEAPGVKNLTNSYKMDFLRYLQNAHTYHFTGESLNNLLSTNGFNMITGNEVIQSVYRKKSENDITRRIVNDYNPALKYLKKLEIARRLFPIPPYKVVSFCKSLIGKAAP